MGNLCIFIWFTSVIVGLTIECIFNLTLVIYSENKNGNNGIKGISILLDIIALILKIVNLINFSFKLLQ